MLHKALKRKICKDKFVLCTTYNVQCIMCFEKDSLYFVHFIFLYHQLWNFYF